MALLHPYRSRSPTTPPADAMDHRRLPGAHDADAGAAAGDGKRLSMRRRSLSAPARSLVHSASAAAKGSAPAAGWLLPARRRRVCWWFLWRARRGGGSGSGGAGEGASAVAPATAGRRVLGMPGWCSQEKGTEVAPRPRGDGDGEDAAEEAVESDDDEEEEDDEKVRWRRCAGAGEEGSVGGSGGCGARAWPVGMGGGAARVRWPGGCAGELGGGVGKAGTEEGG